jgi:hypothetical protein
MKHIGPARARSSDRKHGEALHDQAMALRQEHRALAAGLQ